MIEHTDYRLAFVLPMSRQLLAVRTACNSELPIIRIPLWQRPAEQLTRLIQERWGVQVLLLDVLWDKVLPSPCAIIEVRTLAWEFTREGLCPVPIDDISSLALGVSERTVLHSILAGGNAGRGPFSRIGWIEEVQSWIQVEVKHREVSFTGEMSHLNGGGEFCLLRLGTDSGPAYWLKATGGFNAREFGITTYLASHHPEYLPRVVATRSDWNAWVMEEFGSSLHDSYSLEDFERAAYKLAHLQKQLVGKADDLLNVHCGDHRIETLRTHIDEVVAYLDEAMALQTSSKVPKLPTTRLKELGYVLHQTCSNLEQLGIPDSLMHNDISPGSILDNGSDCVFTDWCEAYVGNPFITLEQLCAHVGRKTNESEIWAKKLKAVYKSCWIDVLTENQIDCAIQLVPLVSVFSYLYGRGDWLQSPRRIQPAFLSYSRSLARHMNRIAANQGLVEALCLPT